MASENLGQILFDAEVAAEVGAFPLDVLLRWISDRIIEAQKPPV